MQPCRTKPTARVCFIYINTHTHTRSHTLAFTAKHIQCFVYVRVCVPDVSAGSPLYVYVLCCAVRMLAYTCAKHTRRRGCDAENHDALLLLLWRHTKLRLSRRSVEPVSTVYVVFCAGPSSCVCVRADLRVAYFPLFRRTFAFRSFAVPTHNTQHTHTHITLTQRHTTVRVVCVLMCAIVCLMVVV